MKTTLHNHKALGDENKPLITNMEFKQLIEKLKSGDKSAYDQIKNAKSFEPFQLNLIKQLYARIS